MIVVLGCRSGQPLNEPPAVRFGEDVCAECGMIISESRFAASYVTTTGEVRNFESIADMLSYHLRQQEPVHLFWVHDYYGDEWVRGDAALYVLSEQIVTPMGDHLLAAADQTKADRLVHESGGTIIHFEQLMKLAQNGDLFVHQRSSHTEGHDH
jgi:copper chaperone NosL